MIKLLEFIGVMTLYGIITLLGGYFMSIITNDSDYSFCAYMVSTIIFLIIVLISISKGYFGL